jgi:hypothetical protein
MEKWTFLKKNFENSDLFTNFALLMQKVHTYNHWWHHFVLSAKAV